MTIRSLGEDQWKWLYIYGSIDLTHWRMELFTEHGNEPDWYYVGRWKPIRSHEEDPDADGGYGERSRNLKGNRFFYWP